jgi:hypothetical protein
MKMSLGAQNIKTGPDALGTAENEVGRAKHENWTRWPSIVQNESGSAKHENWTRRSRYRAKTSRGAQNMKTGPDAHGSAENEFRSTKHENSTRRLQNRRK